MMVELCPFITSEALHIGRIAKITNPLQILFQISKFFLNSWIGKKICDDPTASNMYEALNSAIYICFHATAVGALLHIFRLICAANYDCCGALSGAKRLWINVIMRQLISPVAFVNQDFRMYNCMCSHEVWEMKFFHFHSI